MSENTHRPVTTIAPWYQHLASAVGGERGDDTRIIETHISVVVLSGQFAYKLKKPVQMPFLDFRDLEQRKFYLLEELRLNRRTAPDLYLDVIPVCGAPQHPRLNGSGPVFDYALQMVRFPQENMMSSMIRRNELSIELIEALARSVAAFHERITRTGATSAPRATDVFRRQMLDNFELLVPWAGEHKTGMLSTLEVLKSWSEQWLAEHAPMMTERERAGAVRECHGDLHLGNIVVLDGQPTPFDCIEFSDTLRWIDVANEIAFVTMDLQAHERSDLANVLLNTYLQETGDYDALGLVAGFMVYRSLVRAKVAALTDRAHGSDDSRDITTSVSRYITLAKTLAAKTRTALVVITHGLSGSGKSWLAKQLAAELGAVQIRSDVERRRAKRKFDYSEDSIDRVYRQLESICEVAINAGYAVIVDATFLHRRQRARFMKLADRLQAPLIILSADAPTELLKARIAKRRHEGTDVSEATLEVLENQLRNHEPLEANELAHQLRVDTSEQFDAGGVAEEIRHLAFGRC